MSKVNRSVTIDEKLLEVVNEIIPNRSVYAEKGLLDEVLNRLDKMKPEEAKDYREKIAHLTDK